jgi:hypothetical protein
MVLGGIANIGRRYGWLYEVMDGMINEEAEKYVSNCLGR